MRWWKLEKVSSGEWGKKSIRPLGKQRLQSPVREQGELLSSSMHGPPGPRKQLRLYQEFSCVAYTFLYLYLWPSPVSNLILTGAI